MTERPTRLQIGDIVAGISVALVLIPQSLAYAELAGMPAHHGLYAAALPTIAAAVFASSRYLQTGPVAMTSLLTIGALTSIGPTGPEEYIGLAALLAVVVGVVRMAIGGVGGGWLSYLMSQPVLMGFTSAAAILIIMSQAPTAFGIGTHPETGFVDALLAVGDPSAWNPLAIALAALTIGLVLGSRIIHRLFPGLLIAVVIGVIVGAMFPDRVATLGDVPAGLPPLVDALPWRSLPHLLVPGAVIAVIGFAEASAISRTFATIDREEWNPNREFLSQGAANIFAGLTSGFPVGGSFSRSSINRLSGARTRWSGAVTGATVLLFLPFSGLLAPLPRAILAGIVIGAVANLVRIDELVRLVSRSWFQAGVAWTTFAFTLVLAPRVDYGILIGVGLSVLIHLYRETRLEVQTDVSDQTVRLTPVGVLYFGSAPGLDQALMHALATHPEAKIMVVDLGRLGRVDYTGAIALRRAVLDARNAGLNVRIVHIPPQARGILRRVLGVETALDA